MSVLSEYSIDWQHIVVLIYALETMSGDIPTRAGTMEHIQASGLLQLRPEDRRPYKSQKEPSWQTDMAWARKNAVMMGFVNNYEWNSWELARPGRDFLKTILRRFQEGATTATRCFLWSYKFKQSLDPRYVTSDMDSMAPPKGERSNPNIEEYKRLLDENLKNSSIVELANRISGLLGLRIPPTEPSVAFAYHLYSVREQEVAIQNMYRKLGLKR